MNIAACILQLQYTSVTRRIILTLHALPYYTASRLEHTAKNIVSQLREPDNLRWVGNAEPKYSKIGMN